MRKAIVSITRIPGTTMNIELSGKTITVDGEQKVMEELTVKNIVEGVAIALNASMDFRINGERATKDTPVKGGDNIVIAKKVDSGK